MKDISLKKVGKTVSRDDGYDTDSDDSLEDLQSFEDSVTLSTEADFGILFDVDGVLAYGANPLTAAVRAIRALEDKNGQLRVPVAFVTNSCNRSQDKAAQIQRWLGIHVTPDQVVHSPTPLKLLHDLHDKHVLVVGQEHRLEIIKDLGFSNVCTIEEVCKAFPLLDMVNHDNRNAIATGTHNDDPNFPPVEAIVLIGEPTHWECHLQLLIDLILTGGVPNKDNANQSGAGIQRLPVIACNMDLLFMHQASMPRFGHGAFLVCLEALFKKITGRELEYEALVGKPCEISYRYGENVVCNVAKRLGIHKPLNKLYFIGDNANVDVVGANLYNRYLQKVWENRDNGNPIDDVNDQLPSCRRIPANTALPEQTVRSMESILVGTGVYKADENTDSRRHVYHGHREFVEEPGLSTPTIFVPDVHDAIKYILKQENFDPNNVTSIQPEILSTIPECTCDNDVIFRSSRRLEEHSLREIEVTL